MGSQNKYLKPHFFIFGINIQLLVATTYQTMQRNHKIAKNDHLHEKYEKQNFPIIFNFTEKQHMQGHEFT